MTEIRDTLERSKRRPRRATLTGLFLSLVLGVVACFGDPWEFGEATVPCDPCDLVFISRRDGNPEIYGVNADGGGLVRLTTHPGVDEAPTWSPDGTTLAFASDRDGDLDIFTMAANGTGLTNLTSSPGSDFEPQWSPVDDRLLFLSQRDGHRQEASFDLPPASEIYVMNADGTGVVNLTQHEAEDAHPRWSPDGSSVAFVSSRDGPWHVRRLHVMDADGTNLRFVPGGREPLDWSPDGQRLIVHQSYSVDRGGPPRPASNVVTVRVDGTEEVPVTNPEVCICQRWDGDGTWSRDGSRILFSSDREGFVNQLFLINPDGSDLIRILQTPGGPLPEYGGGDRVPRWSPDGQRIAFVHHHGLRSDIFVVNADGTNLIRLTGDGVSGSPVWRPVP